MSLKIRPIIPLLLSISFLLRICSAEFDPNNVLYAVNCGGSEFEDSLGIVYKEDPYMDEEDPRHGVASDFGKSLVILRVDDKDAPLYQTERYSHKTFTYNLPVPPDGDYVLVLKFCEVYFDNPGLKIFDVYLNNVLIVSNLDIFDKVGKAVAYDEYIPFTIKNKRLHFDMADYPLKDDLYVEFVKGTKDNPKVNAILLYKGYIEDIPKLLPLAKEVPEDVTESPRPEVFVDKRTAYNPYDSEDFLTNYWPILVTLAAFFPILLCLCNM